MEIIDELLTKKITIGVTGLSRAGKTVFICALAQALLTAEAWTHRRGQGPLSHFGPFERREFRFARIRDDINSHLPQYPFRQVRNNFVGHDSAWPEPTEGISRLVLDIDYTTKKRWVARSEKRIRIELVDYPGEWLVDLPMLRQSYSTWSDSVLQQAARGPRQELSKRYLDALKELTPQHAFDAETTGKLADYWSDYLHEAADKGLARNQPGRMIRPDTIRHSPVLRLSPLPDHMRHSPVWQGMEKRYEEYKRKIIKPFYKEHFKSMDRQIVLLDVLRYIELGEYAFNEMLDTLKDTLTSFRYGKGSLLSWLGGANTTHVLFAATKADHVVRGDRANLQLIMRKMLSHVDENNLLRSKAADYEVMELASVRATEDRMTVKSPKREILYGKPAQEQQYGQWDPGALPLDMPPDWSQVDFRFYKFLPLPMTDAMHEGFPAINLGKALDFLVEDIFR